MNKINVLSISDGAVCELCVSLISRLRQFSGLRWNHYLRNDLRCLFQLAALTTWSRDWFEDVYLTWYYGLD